MALYRGKKRKLWIWRAIDHSNNKTIGWIIGDRDANTFKKFYEKIKDKAKLFYTDKWKVYKEIIPENKLIQSKKYTYNIEQNNSNVRHYLARMTRRTKVVSKSIEMIDISLKIAYWLKEGGLYENF